MPEHDPATEIRSGTPCPVRSRRLKTGGDRPDTIYRTREEIILDR